MLFIDPSELRKTSQLKRHLSGVVYEVLPGLESDTGADVMISPGICGNSHDIQHHIDNGSKLIQLKFGHDLPLSISDGRLNESLSRMQKITNERSWQCLLLFIGLLGCDNTDQMATINGQLTYGNYPMKWRNLDIALNYWIDRGGSILFPLPSGKLIKQRFENIQYLLDRYADDNRTREFWPKIPVMYDTIKPKNPHLAKWSVAQKLIPIDDIRLLFCAIPEVRIGEKKANAIYSYMKENDIRLDFNGFLEIVEDERLLKVPGIGKKILSNINRGLFKTSEERKRK